MAFLGGQQIWVLQTANARRWPTLKERANHTQGTVCKKLFIGSHVQKLSSFLLL